MGVDPNLFVGDSKARLVIALTIGVLTAVIMAWCRGRRPKRTHEWRIRSAARAIAVLKDIGIRRGPAAQMSYLKRIDPLTFEEMILTSIAVEGHKIRRNQRYTSDGGIDGECEIDGTRLLLQAKRYAGHIRWKHVTAFAAECRRRRVNGLFIHAGKTGKRVLSLADSSLQIVSGSTLLRCLGVVPDEQAEKSWRSIVIRAYEAARKG